MVVQETQIEQPPGSAWQNLDFRRVWAAQSVSLFGSQVTLLAVPLTATLSLHATPLQMGLLGAAGQAPFLLFSLLAGVWVDHTRRRRLLIWSDLLRAALLCSVPLAAWLHLLNMGQLYAVTFLVGTLTVGFEVAHLAYVPSVLSRAHLLDGNSKLQLSYSAADAAGPGLGGVIVQWLSAPMALLADTASFIGSALLIWRVRQAEPPPPPRRSVRVWAEVGQGLGALLGHPLLRPVILSSMLMVLFGNAVGAQYVLYATRHLHLTPGLIGLIAAAGGLGAIPGALLTQRLAARFGVGPTIIGGFLLQTLMGLAVPLAVGPAVLVVVFMGLAQVLGGLADTVANVQQWSLRQLVTPDVLQGRVTASHRFLVYGSGALGALLGGALASWLGVREAILMSAVLAVLGVLPVVFSPLVRLRDMPAPVES